MAQKRMFDKSIVCCDDFIDMPATTQNLYFHLNMQADDDGFVNNWKSIMRMCGAKEDDIKLLITKSYVIAFESGIIVIKHWKINNFLRKDRHIDTKYLDELNMLEVDCNGAYALSSNNIVDSKLKRKIAYSNSDLPYSFEYKIKQAFSNKICPICGAEMKNYSGYPNRPTVQHNIPISKGGKHELGNISVICHECNISLRDTITDNLNNDEVIKKWHEING